MGWKRNVGIGAAVVFGVAVIGAALGDPATEPKNAAPSLEVEGEPEFIAMPQPDSFAMIMAPGADVAATEAAVFGQCQGRQFCKVMGWTDKVNAAQSLPMLDRELEAMAFSYFVNRTGGDEEFAWDCARFPQPDPARCLAK